MTWLKPCPDILYYTMIWYNELVAPVAQWIERVASDHEVGGSSPSGRTENLLVKRLCKNILHANF